MKEAARLLTQSLKFELAPDQDLSFDLSRMPALPKSRVILTQIRPHEPFSQGG